MHPIICPSIFQERRQRLQQQVQGDIFLVGTQDTPRNFRANLLPFRQDSSFWYFTGCSLPNVAWLSTPTQDVLFLPKQDPSDALWHGKQPSNSEIATSLGFSEFREFQGWDDVIAALPRDCHTLATTHILINQALSTKVNYPLEYGIHNGSDVLIDAIVQMRRILQPEEIAQLKWTAEITHDAHVAAMKQTRVGRTEQELAATFHFPIQRAGLSTAYQSIVTVRGEILHNHHYHNKLEDGQLLLLDGGAESPNGYATDVTRTWPVSGRFSDRQHRAYSAVLQAQEVAISMVRPGVGYRDIHHQTCLTLTEYLVEEGLLLGIPENLVEEGAHALFFPHGVGHLLGLDVHDMELFGDRAAYASGRKRSTQFGTAYLRLDLDLEPGMVVTIEPGFYIVPSILEDEKLYTQFKSSVNWDLVEVWKQENGGFGGIRIEDDIHCTTKGPENLTQSIPKSIAELEALIGTDSAL